MVKYPCHPSRYYCPVWLFRKHGHHTSVSENTTTPPDPTKLISTYYAALMTDCNPRFRVAPTKWASMDITLQKMIQVISSKNHIINWLPQRTWSSGGLLTPFLVLSNSPRLLDGDRGLHLIGNSSPEHSPPQNLPSRIATFHPKRLLHILHFYAKKGILSSWKGSQILLQSFCLKSIIETLCLSIETHV